MNYRHAFHAGNFADCMKHAVVVLLLRALLKKPAPLFVLDTHAGLGHYDLESGASARTREANDGIMRLLNDTPAPLEDYVGLVRSLGLYPGSPGLIRRCCVLGIAWRAANCIRKTRLFFGGASGTIPRSRCINATRGRH